MWVKATNRRELIDIVQAERLVERADRLFSRYDFSAVSSLSSVETREELLLVWQDDPREVQALPNLIVTGSIEQRDFFAWALTYLHALRPLTAYIRVSTYQTAEQALKLQPVPTLHRLEDACVGLMLGETATYLDGQRDLKQMPARTCASTYSFAMARSLALGGLTLEKDLISSAWFDARELTRQSKLPLTRPVLQAPWRVLLGLENGTWGSYSKEMELPLPMLEACLDLFLKGDIDARQWHSLESEVPGISDFGNMMRGPREDRVLAFEEVAARLRIRQVSKPVALAFALGYLASQIAPGTMDHLHLLSPYVHIFPGVLMWYGLCAGLHRRSTVASYAGGLGRRAIREVLRSESFLDRPTCDVGISELQIINSKAKGIFDFRTDSNNQIDIEIAPCVTATFRWPPRSDVSQPPVPQKTNIEEVETIRFDLEDAADELRAIAARLDRLTTSRETRPSKIDRKPRRK
jgi:hypothetical protein